MSRMMHRRTAAGLLMAGLLAGLLVVTSGTTAATTADGNSIHWGTPAGSASTQGSIPMDPVLDRQTSVFNLLEIPVLGEMLAALCPMKPYGCPNLGFFQSSSLQISASQQDASLVVTAAATSDLPVVVFASFNLASSFNLTSLTDVLHCKTTTCYEQAVKSLAASEYSALMSMQANVYGSAVAMQSIVEFEDDNGNGVYDPSDSIVSLYDFSLPSADAPALWGPMLDYTIYQPGVGNKYVLNVTTQDGIFSVEYSTTDAAPADPNTQASTKMSWQIRDYPFMSPTSRLAVMVYLASTSGEVETSLNEDNSGLRIDVVNGNGNTGYFSWAPTAQAVHTAGDGDIQVKVSQWTSVTPVMELSLLRSIAQTVFSSNGNAVGGTVGKYAFFSFDAVNPSYVYWDPELGYGRPVAPGASPDGSLIVIAAVCGGVAVTLTVLAVFWVRHRATLPTQDADQPLINHADLQVVVVCHACGSDGNNGIDEHCGNCGSLLRSSYGHAVVYS